MYLGGAYSKHLGSETEISASVGSTRLWYRIPAQLAAESTGNAFLVAALMPAMAKGENLEVSPAICISPRLFRTLPKIQGILHAWNPALKQIEVVAEVRQSAPVRAGAACFFSGGVDSTFTCLRHLEDITHLVLIHGLDIPPDDDASFSQAFERGAELARRLGKTLIKVRTNAREFCKAGGLTMVLFHGALLASVSLLLGFERSYIAASHTYDDLEPWGSHALLDPLWSTESCEIIYDGGDAHRIEKVRAISQHLPLLNSLRVCASNQGEYNCGKCEKCLRTMIALRLVGADTAPFPELAIERLKKLPVNFENFVFYLENYEFAKRVGDTEIEKALRSALRRFELRQLLKRADAVLLSGLVTRWLGAEKSKSEPPALLRPQPPKKNRYGT